MKLTVRKSVFNPHFLPLLENNDVGIILLVGGGGS